MLVDTNTYAVSHISLKPEPSHAVAIDPALHTVYLTSGAFGSITMVDARTRRIAASRLTAGTPYSGRWSGGIAVDAITHEIYVTQGESAHTIEILAPS
ncbi:hypothetical protein ACQP1O_19995 [Nocardia sp. CA-151230]|uniref:hypothetical protein n=1 Tax=Nocardia sp. CA-151230 TaxID=3239982 RepID=UPI003D945187